MSAIDVSAIAVQVIRQVIEGWRLPYDNLNDHDLDVLAQRIDEALFDPLWRERQIMNLHWDDTDPVAECCNCNQQFRGATLNGTLQAWLAHFQSACPTEY